MKAYICAAITMEFAEETTHETFHEWVLDVPEATPEAVQDALMPLVNGVCSHLGAVRFSTTYHAAIVEESHAEVTQ